VCVVPFCYSPGRYQEFIPEGPALETLLQFGVFYHTFYSSHKNRAKVLQYFEKFDVNLEIKVN